MRPHLFLVLLFFLVIPSLFFLFLPPAFPKRHIQAAESLIWESPDSSLQLLEEIPLSTLSPREKALYGLIYTQALYHSSHPLLSDSLIFHSVSFYSCHGTSSRYGTALVYLSNVYIDQGNYTKAYQVALQAVSHVAQLSPRVTGLLWNTLFYICRKQGDLSSAVQWYNKAQNHHSKYGYDDWMAINRYNVLNIPYFIQYPDSAFRLIDSLRSRIDLLPPPHPSFAYNNIGKFYETLGDTSTAASYYKEALCDTLSFSVSALLNLARHYDRLGLTEFSDSLYNRYIPFSTPAGKVEISRHLLYRSYVSKNPSDILLSATRFESCLREFYDSLHLYQMNTIRSEFSSEKTLLQHKRKQYLLLSLVFGVFILLLLSWYFYRHYMHYLFRLERSKYARLSEQLHEMSLSLSSATEANEAISAQLSQALDNLRNKDIQIRQWQTICCLPSCNLSIDDLRSLNFYIEMRYLKRIFRSSSDQNCLEHWMNMVHHSFYSRIHSTYPFLSLSEVNLICFFRMGFTLQEVSDIYTIQIKSLHQRIYRCCTHLGLPHNLPTFIEFVRTL